jgi:hypothetical protein
MAAASNTAASTLVKATISPVPKGKPEDAITVHFNPASLVYTIEAQNPQQSGDNKRRQHAADFTGKLTMDLQFDTTDTGSDVRKFTTPIAKFMEPSAAANQKSKSAGSHPPAPAVLCFEWGSYVFNGYMETFKETIDFFSPNGVPLRALVSIGLARQSDVFDTGSKNYQSNASSLVPTAPGTSATDAASKGGDDSSARALAAQNGLENPRFTDGSPLEVGGGIQLNPPVGFVAAAASASVGAGFGISAGAGIGISAGAGIGISAGAGIGVSAGAGFGAGASAGFGLGASAGFSAGVSASAGVGFSAGAFAGASASAGFSASAGASFSASAGVSVSAGGSYSANAGPVFGSRASAGVPATMGAFAGLEVGRVTVSTTAQLNPLSMLPATVGSDISTSSNASFGLGGAALSPTGFSAGVGGGISVNGLVFDSD